MSVFGICENGCKYKVYTCGETLALLQQAINNGTLEGIDAELAAISKMIDRNSGTPVAFWTGTEAEFNALSPAPEVTRMLPRRGSDGMIYLCTDDSSLDNLGGNGSGGGAKIGVDQADGVTTLTIINPDGTSETVQIEDGADPEKGVDYFTDDDKREIAEAAAEIVEENKVADIDFSAWADGEFTVTMSDETEKSGAVYFDSSGNPASVTLDGHTMTITLPA